MYQNIIIGEIIVYCYFQKLTNTLNSSFLIKKIIIVKFITRISI